MLSIPCQRYIRFVCRVLEMPVPDVMIREKGRFVDMQGNVILDQPFQLHAGNTLICLPHQSRLYVDVDRNDRDAYFKIAHSLRHIWQERNEWHLDGTLDPDAPTCSSLESEMDADAFAQLITSECFRNRSAGDELLEQVRIQLAHEYSPRYISECLHKTA